MATLNDHQVREVTVVDQTVELVLIGGTYDEPWAGRLPDGASRAPRQHGGKRMVRASG